MLIDHFVTAHLTIMGIFRNRKYENYEKYLLTLLITMDVIIFLSFIIVFPQAQLFVHQCSIITTNLGAFVFCLHRIVVNTRKAQMLRIIKTLRSDASYFNETRVQMNEHINLSKNFYRIAIKVFSFLLFAFIMPYIFVLSNDIDYNDPAVYAMPYLYHFRDVHTLRAFLILQILQGITIMHFAITFFSFIGFVNCVSSNIAAHITEVNLQLSELINDFSMQPKLEMKNEKNQNLFMDQFINIIKYQLHIQKYTKDFASLLSPIFSYYVLQFVSVALGFTVLGAEMLESNAVTVLQNFSVLINVMYGFYTWCNVCENISYTNETLRESFYQTEWYKLPLKIRKLMITTMIHTQRPRTIRAFGIFTINFGLGLQVLKVIYSTINLLRFKGRSMA